MIKIRLERPGEVLAIRDVNEKAFGEPLEADIIDKIRANCINTLSLVAVNCDDIVGHILFSPAVIDTEQGVIKGMGLAPMAVLPEYQKQGIGSKLVNEGFKMLREMLCPFVIVLGHPGYYPRFGFERASDYGLKSQWEEVPQEAFMIKFFDETIKPYVSGIGRYRDEFDEAM